MLRCRSIAVAVLVACLSSFAARAQSVRTFVSTSGIDNATCSKVDPCRTFTAAAMAVNAGGEIVPLDSGGYGAFTITKSLAVLAPGGIQASIAPTFGPAITVFAAPGDKVTLRGLLLNDQGSSSYGIEFRGGSTLHVRQCEIVGFGFGLWATRSGSDVFVHVSDTIFRDGTHGVSFEHTDGLIHAVLSRCTMANHLGRGAWVRGNVRFVAHEVLAEKNYWGFDFGGDAPQEGALDHCVIAGNTFGVLAANNATVRMTGCTVTHNHNGVSEINMGTVVSLGNNLIEGNGHDVDGTLTIIPGK